MKQLKEKLESISFKVKKIEDFYKSLTSIDRELFDVVENQIIDIHKRLEKKLEQEKQIEELFNGSK